MYQYDNHTAAIMVGARFSSRSGKATYTVTDTTDNGFTARRDGSGKLVKITGRAIGKALTSLRSGVVLRYQANATKGGISYTSAIEAGVVAALGPAVKATPAGWSAA